VHALVLYPPPDHMIGSPFHRELAYGIPGG
jgi:hypothetical protein